MPAKKSVKKSAGNPAKKASKRAVPRPAQAMKRTVAGRPAKRAPTVAKPAPPAPRRVPKGVRPADLPRLKTESGIEMGVGPANVPGPDPKAEHAREHMKKMGGTDSQRVEEHHRMTRHKKNQ